MSGPASVSNARMGLEHLVEVDIGLGDELLELGYFADLFEGKDLILLVTVNG